MSSHPSDAETCADGRARRTVLVIATLTAVLATFLVPKLAGAATSDTLDASFGPSAGIWIDRDTIRSLPMTGSAWDNLARDAASSWGTAAIADQESMHDVLTLAGALYAVRTNDVRMRTRVVSAIEAAMGTEDGGRTLALGRNLTGYVLAADIVGYRSSQFEQWLRDVRFEVLESRTLVSTHEDRPNNWGTHAGAARMAAAIYLGDDRDLQRAATVFRGYLGDRSAYAGFRYGDLEWQSDAGRPVGINPKGAVKNGVDLDGAMPDDQRRCECVVQDPVPHENYVWEAMQGTVTQATLLARHGQPDVWSWSDAAIARAARWLHETVKYPAQGDDRFLPFLLDAGLGTSYSAGVEARSGKSIGYTDWTHAPGAAGTSTSSSSTSTSTSSSSTTTSTSTSTTAAPTTTTAAPTTTTTTTAAPTTTTSTTSTTTVLRDVKGKAVRLLKARK